MNLRGNKLPQSYVHFGASTGDTITGEKLTTFQLCDFIVEVGRKHPASYHVGFALTYDMNMIIQSLGSNSLAWLHKHGYVNVRDRSTGRRYCIIMRKGKWFSVTRYIDGWDRTKNPHAKHTVRIYDIFSFFACSFVKAVEDMLGKDTPGLDIIREGKDQRKNFTYEEIEYVQKYWSEEIRVLALLAEELRRRFYKGGFTIIEWHGPGALASFAMRKHGIKNHMAVNQDEVREAARYAFAAGRFELSLAGRVVGPVYGIDRNSAYPFAIAQLPSMSEGRWIHVNQPDHISHFGVYHVKLSRSAGFDKASAPLFHRDKNSNISYPWIVEGWYWSPEVNGLLNKPGVEVIEGWEYVDWHTLPFAFFNDWYEERRARKMAYDPSQLGFKLGMNAAFGKMAQRVGWDEEHQRIPPWHQLEWAGWVTSHCRAAMYRLMMKIPQDQLIAVETDGIYTTAEPSSIGVVNESGFGKWEVTEWDEVMYVQSGLAWLRQGDKWSSKRRGLDKDSFTHPQCVDYLRSLNANQKWDPFQGETTRFIGLGSALASKAPLKTRHCLWETRQRDISPGEHGKRIHVGKGYCRACALGQNAYGMAHDLVIRSHSRAGEMSTPHNIPWEGRDTGAVEEWRDYEEELGDVIHDE